MFNTVITLNKKFSEFSIIKEKSPEELEAEHQANLDTELKEEEPPKDFMQITAEDFERELEVSFQKGYHDGELQGFKKCEKELKPNLKLFDDVVQAMEAQRAEFIKKSETFMVTLAGKIAKKIVQTEIKFNPQIIQKIVGNLIKRVLDDEEIEIFVNPEDAPIIIDYKTELLAMNSQLKRINIEADPKVIRGGCLVETKSGLLDSRLDEMFEEIEKAMLKYFEQ